jgi:LacI family transcriptional regulator
MALSERGFATVVANTDEDPALQAQVVSAMIEHGVSAFILAPAYGDVTATFNSIARASIPAMQVLRKVEQHTEIFPFSAPDYPTGSRLATEHLLATGARRIAFVGGLEGRGVTQERMSGYRAAIAGAGMVPLVLTGRASRAFGREAALQLTREHPESDAALCFNDLVALGMLSGFAKLGKTVGAEFRVVGFDDIEDCAQAWPPLSSVRCDIARFGKRIAATVLDWLELGLVPAPETRTPVELVIRESSRFSG